MARISIRSANASDGPALRRVAERDSGLMPAGDLLVAEVDGEVHAAYALLSGAVVADPFRPTAQLVELLRLRARQVERPRQGTKRPWTARTRLLVEPVGGADKLGGCPPGTLLWTREHSPSD